MKTRNRFLQREAYSPSIANVPARDSSPEERGNPSLSPLQQWGDWILQQVADPCPLNLPQLIEALQCLGVVQEPGDQQLVGEQPHQGEIEQAPQMSGQPSLSLHQLIEALQQLGAVPKPGELQPVSLQIREAQHVQQPLRGLQQQRASPPPAVLQQRRPLQPPLAQPPLRSLQQQGAPPAPAGQQQRAQQQLDQQVGWGQQQLGAPRSQQRAQQPLDQQAGWGQQQLGARQARRLDQQPGWGPQQPELAPPFKATFNGDPEKLIFFINQVRSHLNRWAYLYPEPGAMVDVIASNLEGEASEWLNNLYSEQAPELEGIPVV